MSVLSSATLSCGLQHVKRAGEIEQAPATECARKPNQARSSWSQRRIGNEGTRVLRKTDPHTQPMVLRPDLERYSSLSRLVRASCIRPVGFNKAS
jgi:hypothetical protein